MGIGIPVLNVGRRRPTGDVDSSLIDGAFARAVRSSRSTGTMASAVPKGATSGRHSTSCAVMPRDRNST